MPTGVTNAVGTVSVSQDFSSDDLFYRYIHPKLAGADGWPNSGTFDDDNLSVDLARLVDLDAALVHRPAYGVVGIPKALCDDLGLVVRRDPTDENAAHCLILGRKSGALRRRLEAGCLQLKPATVPTFE